MSRDYHVDLNMYSDGKIEWNENKHFSQMLKNTRT